MYFHYVFSHLGAAYLFSHTLEVRSSRSRYRQGWFLVGILFLACRWLPSHCVLILLFFFASLLIRTPVLLDQASRVALVVKNLPANAGDIRDVGSIPG